MAFDATRHGRRLLKPAAVLAALLVWQLGAAAVDQRLILVSPLTVAGRLVELCPDPAFWSVIGYTFLRITGGLLLGVLVGLLLGALAARFPAVETLLWPYMAAVKAVPVASFIILCLIWLGSQRLSVFIAFLMVLPIVYTNVVQGIRAVDRQLLEMTAVFRVGFLRRVRFVMLPQLRPYVLSACKVAVGLSWKAGVAAEVIGVTRGSIGERLYEAKIYFSTADLFAWTVVIVTLSLAFEKLFLSALDVVFGEGRRIGAEHRSDGRIQGL